MDEIKRTASQMQDAATFLYEELEECETQLDVKEKGFDDSYYKDKGRPHHY